MIADLTPLICLRLSILKYCSKHDGHGNSTSKVNTYIEPRLDKSWSSVVDANVKHTSSVGSRLLDQHWGGGGGGGGLVGKRRPRLCLIGWTAEVSNGPAILETKWPQAKCVLTSASG